MPIVMSFTDAAGVFHENLFILPERLIVNWRRGSALLTMAAYHDTNTWTAGLDPVTTFTVQFSSHPDPLGATFADFFSFTQLANPDFDLPVELQEHISNLPAFEGSIVIPF